ncbi:MAG: RagB/SusD family nutrient uptake outer membrane protein, partial [Bacteroidales bacterium]|nr:RagB/SusD family nutrient uptake outer membrane protein [Bacteroidales bacterium]
AFARAFRARVALQAGGYSLRADDGFGGGGPQMRRSVILDIDEMHQIARDETAYLIANEGRGFTFAPTFEQIFRENMAENVSTGRESIFELPYNPGARGQWLSFHGARHDGVDKFNASAQLVKGETGPTPIMWYWFDGNDIRRDISIIPYRYAAGQTAGTAVQVIQQVQNTPNIRDWYFGKLRAEWGNRRMPNNEDGIKPIIMRYTDVLLMFAEAENFLNGPTNDAQNALRRVRDRAFPTGGDPLNIGGLNETTFHQAIMDERAFEFLGEQRRKYDLIRWNKLKTNLDWARRQTLRMREACNSPDPSLRDIDFAWNDDVRGFPRHIFWRHVPCSCVNVLLCDGNGHTVLEIFGLNRGEFATDELGNRLIIPIPVTQNNPEPAELQTWLNTFDGGGWNRYVGTGAGLGLMLEWIDSRDGGDDGTSGHPFSDEFINNGFYIGAEPLPGTRQMHSIRVNPNMRSLFPIWSSVVSASQGTLNNHPFYD